MAKIAGSIPAEPTIFRDWIQSVLNPFSILFFIMSAAPNHHKKPSFFHGKNGQNSQKSVKSVNTSHYMQKDGFPSMNIGGKERVTRAVLGSTVVVADFLATVHIEIVFLLVGLWGVLTSAFGYCPFNTLMGRNSCVLPEASQKATS